MSVKEDFPKSKKRRFKKRYWLLIDLVVAVIIFVLVLHRPSGYEPMDSAWSDREPGEVHPYWTYLSSEIYNGAQLHEPFEVVVRAERINEATAGWSEVSEGIMLSEPMVFFVTDRIILMATATVKGVELVVTIVIKPTIDERGLLHAGVAKVKVGAMNITPLAKMIAKKMYAERLLVTSIDTKNWQAQVAGSLLNDEPFEPVFPVGDKKVRLGKIAVREKRLILRLVPAS